MNTCSTCKKKLKVLSPTNKEDLKLKRMEYLDGILEKYTKTEPKLSLNDIAVVITWQVGDISKFLKELKKEANK